MARLSVLSLFPCIFTSLVLVIMIAGLFSIVKLLMIMVYISDA